MESITGTSLLGVKKNTEGLWIIVQAPTSSMTIPTTASLFAPGCLCINIGDGLVYRNGGSTASPSWTDVDGTISGNLIVSGTSTLSGAVTVGIDGTGHDVLFYSATASNSWLWDESADKVVQTFVSASTSTVEPHTITSTLSGVGVTGGRFKHALTINAAAGAYTNAIKGDVTYGASGKTTGLGSSVLAEMTLSAGTADGNYALFEGEINLGAGALTGTATSLIYLSVNQTGGNTAFDDSGYVLNLQGLTAAASDCFRTGLTAATINAATTAAIRIKIGATEYFIPLATATA